MMEGKRDGAGNTADLGEMCSWGEKGRKKCESVNERGETDEGKGLGSLKGWRNGRRHVFD